MSTMFILRILYNSFKHSIAAHSEILTDNATSLKSGMCVFILKKSPTCKKERHAEDRSVCVSVSLRGRSQRDTRGLLLVTEPEVKGSERGPVDLHSTETTLSFI